MSTKRIPRSLGKPIDTSALEWIPIHNGLSFKPITYFPDNVGWQLLLRLEPGTVVAPHRHTGEVHAFNLSGARLLINTGEVIGPGTYVYEPVGNCDTWKAVGDEPCIIHVEVNGAIEYLDTHGNVTRVSDAEASLKMYEDYCAERGKPIDAALTARLR
jgi:quercetin dioxygenase-like cupin family protein